MEILIGTKSSHAELVEFYTQTFTESESADEGRTVGELAEAVLDKTAEPDLFIFTAYDGGTVIGCILFTRLTYQNDPRTVFMLSPVAVKSDRQGRGVGQNLIRFGLDYLGEQGVDAATTYGDPNYYIKTGFNPVSIDQMPAPMKLSYPHGWLAQSLNCELKPFKGPCICVDAFKNPEVW